MILNNTSGQFLHGQAIKPANLHFKLTIGDKTLLYTYIRKAACSAFKNFFAAQSPFRSSRSDYASDMAFLADHHRVATLEDIGEFDHSIVVIRDPIERMVSCFVNKFVVRKGNGDIFTSVERTTGRDPSDLSFTQFCTEYLSQQEQSLDPHCHSYCYQLLPIQYTDAIAIESLNHTMATIVGEALAGEYFEQRHNSIGQKKYDDDVSETSSAVLHETFRAKGFVPSFEALVSTALRARLEGIYRDDYAMIRALTSREYASMPKPVS